MSSLPSSSPHPIHTHFSPPPPWALQSKQPSSISEWLQTLSSDLLCPLWLPVLCPLQNAPELSYTNINLSHSLSSLKTFNGFTDALRTKIALNIACESLHVLTSVHTFHISLSALSTNWLPQFLFTFVQLLPMAPRLLLTFLASMLQLTYHLLSRSSWLGQIPPVQVLP